MSSNLSDFNDLAVTAGLGEVARQIWSVVNQAPQQAFNDDIATADKAIAAQQQKDLNAMLERYAKVMATGRATNKVYDTHQKIEYTKTLFTEHIGNKALVKLWLEASTKTVTQDEVLRERNEQIIANDDKGFFNRYYLIYGTKEIWDTVEHERYEAKAIEISDKQAYDVWIKSPDKKRVYQRNIWFDPSRTRRPELDEEVYVNTFVGLPLTRLEIDHAQAQQQAQPILKLVYHLCEYNEALWEWVLRWLAIPLQRPGTKMDTALIFHGHIQGAGKSLFFDKIMRRIYGEYAITLGQGQLESSYNDWIAGKLWTVFEEIFTGQDRYRHMGFVKQLVTGDKVYISKKFVSGWKEDNHVNTVFLSNDMMPLSLEANDRRHVVSYPRQKIPETLLKDVQVAINDPSSQIIQAFYTYLLTLDTGEQNEHTPAIMTAAKQELIKLSQPSWESFYDEWRSGMLPVPYTSCISTELYAFYTRWCKTNNERTTTATKFLSFLGNRETKKQAWYQTPIMATRKQATIICVNIPPEITSQAAYLGKQIADWRTALDDYNQQTNPHPLRP